MIPKFCHNKSITYRGLLGWKRSKWNYEFLKYTESTVNTF